MTFSINKASRFALLSGAALALSLNSGVVDAAPIYKGKDVELTIGANPGGGYDGYARVTARFIAKHIAGNPTIIPRNRPGAGSRKALNWFFNGAPKNGMVFGAFYPSALIDPLMRPKRSKYDITKLNFLGSVNKTARQCIARKDSKVHTFTDLLKHELLVGATSRGGSTRDYAIVMNKLFGTKFKVISGYKGSKGILLSIERGETQGLCGYAWSSLKKAKPTWAKGEFVDIVVQLTMDPHGPMTKLGAPMIWDFVKTDRQRKIMEFMIKQQEFGRPYAMPPGTPKANIKIFRKAIMTTWNSAEFKAGAARARLDVNPISAKAVSTLVSELFATPKNLLKEIGQMTKKPKRKKKKKN
jgi:tripartite-type tricarboxylate transporter receptor subunit TctC